MTTAEHNSVTFCDLLVLSVLKFCRTEVDAEKFQSSNFLTAYIPHGRDELRQILFIAQVEKSILARIQKL